MNNIKANYHTHTSRCGHAHGEDREYVESAIKAGYKILGFSDHSPMIFRTGHHSGHRVPVERAEEYFDSILSLREEYKNDLEIKAGVEVEYYPETFDEYFSYITKFPCEYLILGQHFIWKEENGVSVFGANDDIRRLENYYLNMTEAIKTGRFLYVAHPDSVNYTGPSETFLEYAEKFLVEAKKLNVPLEINRYGYAEGRNYPRKDFWQLVGKIGNPVILGVDAHTPDALEDTASMEEIRQMALDCGIVPIENNILTERFLK